MKRKYAGIWQLALMLVVLVFAAGLMSIFVPVSHAGWQEVLGIDGSVESFISLGSESQDCTYPLEYWVFHGDLWPTLEIQAGTQTYDVITARAILGTSPGEDFSLLLVQHLIIARLNIQNGADPAAVEAFIPQADVWLEVYPIGSTLEFVQQEQAFNLAAELQAYSNGKMGPGECPGWFAGIPATGLPTAAPLDSPLLPPTNTPTMTSTPTGTATLIVLPIRTSTPTVTPTITRVPTITPLATYTNRPIASSTVTPTPLIFETPPDPIVNPTATPIELDCIHTAGYWQGQPGEWPPAALSLGRLSLDAYEALEILRTEAEGKVAYLLAHQLIATQLNLVNGSDPEQILIVIAQAGRWFDQNSLDSEPGTLERKVGLALADSLENYNLGPGRCRENPPTPAPLLTATAAEATPIPQTSSPTHTSQTATTTETLAVPSSTATFTTQPTATQEQSSPTTEPTAEPSFTPSPLPSPPPLPEATETFTPTQTPSAAPP